MWLKRGKRPNVKLVRGVRSAKYGMNSVSTGNVVIEGGT